MQGRPKPNTFHSLSQNRRTTVTGRPVIGGRLGVVVSGAPFVKVRTSVKPICEHCKVIKRAGVMRIICKRNPKHKQRQG